MASKLAARAQGPCQPSPWFTFRHRRRPCL